MRGAQAWPGLFVFASTVCGSFEVQHSSLISTAATPSQVANCTATMRSGGQGGREKLSSFLVVSWGGVRSHTFQQWLEGTGERSDDDASSFHSGRSLHVGHTHQWRSNIRQSLAGGSTLVIFLFRDPVESLFSRASQAHCNNLGGDDCASWIGAPTGSSSSRLNMKRHNLDILRSRQRDDLHYVDM